MSNNLQTRNTSTTPANGQASRYSDAALTLPLT